MTTNQRGFTLTEMAIVLVVVALLLGGMLVPLTAQYDIANTNATQKMLNETRDALLGFAVAHGYLPCPSKSPTDGNEDRAASGTCNKRYGLVPWVTLSSSRLDAWNQLVGYSVTPAFSNSAPPLFGLTTSADITIKNRDSGGNLINLTTTDDIPVVIFSFGKNGFYAMVDGAAAANGGGPGGNVDEVINANQVSTSNGGRIFVSRVPTPSGTTNGEFDDIVTWLSPNILYNRMVAAGKLP
jgi:prepilin-type N-terminal cleavage/methylation domain-containing protein